MKILLISPKPPPVGGIASWTLHILGFFSKRERDIEVIHLNSALRKDKIVDRSLFERITNGCIHFRHLYGNLISELKKSKPDIVHITSSGSLALFRDYLFLSYIRKRGYRSVIHFRFGRIPQLIRQNNWEWKMLKRVINMADKCIVIDQSSFKSLEEWQFNNLYYLPNPISENFFLFSEENYGTLERDEGVILFVGHVRREKGILDLVNSIKTLDCIKELRIIGPFDESIKSEVGKIVQAAEKKVIFMGVKNLETVAVEMAKSSVFVLPSYTEGFPNVIVEAMVMGCPIIATDVGAIPEMLQFDSPQPAGLKVMAGDVDSLRNAIMLLVENKVLASTLGSNARRKSLESYTIEPICSKLVKIWET